MRSDLFVTKIVTFHPLSNYVVVHIFIGYYGASLKTTSFVHTKTNRPQWYTFPVLHYILIKSAASYIIHFVESNYSLLVLHSVCINY